MRYHFLVLTDLRLAEQVQDIPLIIIYVISPLFQQELIFFFNYVLFYYNNGSWHAIHLSWTSFASRRYLLQKKLININQKYFLWWFATWEDTKLSTFKTLLQSKLIAKVTSLIFNNFKITYLHSHLISLILRDRVIEPKLISFGLS